MAYQFSVRKLWIPGVALSAILASAASIKAATVNSIASGAWNVGGTWSGGTLPSAATNDDFVIGSGHTITSTSSGSAFTTGTDTLTVNTSGTLSLLVSSGGNQVYTFYGLTVNGGTINHGGTASSTQARQVTIAPIDVNDANQKLVIGENGATVVINRTGTDSNFRRMSVSMPLSGSGKLTVTGNYNSGFNAVGNDAGPQVRLGNGVDNSNFTGNIDITNGTVLAVSANALGGGNGTTTLRRLAAGNAYVTTLSLFQGVTIANETLYMDSAFGSVRLAVNGDAPVGNPATTWNGPIIAMDSSGNSNSSIRLEGNQGRALVIGGNIDGTNHNGLISFRSVNSGDTNESVMNGQINKPTDHIADRVGKIFNNTWTFTNANNIIGTYVAGGGNTNLGAHNALGNSDNGPVLLMGTDGTVGKVELNGFNQKISGLGLDRSDVFVDALAGAAQSNMNAHDNEITNSSETTSTLTILPNNTIVLPEYTGYLPNQRFPGKITGNINLVVNLGSPSSKLTFENGIGEAYGASANTYSGTTTVTQGILQIDGTHVNGSGYTVESNGTLGGNGSTASAVLIETGGTLAPGASIGTFSVGSAAIEGTLLVEFAYDLDTDTVSMDMLNVVGDLDLNALSTISFAAITGSDPLPLGEYVFASYGGELSGLFGVEDVPDGFKVAYNYGDTGNQLALVPVPEPVSAILIGIGGLLELTVLYRKRKGKK